MAFQLRGEKRCAVSINGDGGTSEGAFYEGDEHRRRAQVAGRLHGRKQQMGNLAAD